MSARAIAGEALGSALLLAIVVGSGMMGEALAGGNVAIALLANSTATGVGLAVLVWMFAPISGAHFNPLVSIVEALRGGISGGEAALRSAAQLLGAGAGVILAHAMFEHAAVAVSTHARAGLGQALGEAVATFGLVGVVTVLPRTRPEATALCVGGYIASAYWFTSSTSFANPAVTMARTLTDTFTGIRPADVPAFVAAQAIGALLGMVTFGWLVPRQAPAKEAP